MTLSAEDVNKMKVAELRVSLHRSFPTFFRNVDFHLALLPVRLQSELSSRELPTSGLKKQLVERLLEALEGSTPQNGAGAADPTGQVAGDAPEIADGARKTTDNLPSEMPAVPPTAEDSVADHEGKEPTVREEQAVNEAETSGEPSEVVRPDVNSIDQTPGVVSETKAPESTLDLATDANGTGEKRKREDEPSASDIVVQPRRPSAGFKIFR